MVQNQGRPLTVNISDTFGHRGIDFCSFRMRISEVPGHLDTRPIILRRGLQGQKVRIDREGLSVSCFHLEAGLSAVISVTSPSRFMGRPDNLLMPRDELLMALANAAGEVLADELGFKVLDKVGNAGVTRLDLSINRLLSPSQAWRTMNAAAKLQPRWNPLVTIRQRKGRVESVTIENTRRRAVIYNKSIKEGLSLNDAQYVRLEHQLYGQFLREQGFRNVEQVVSGGFPALRVASRNWVRLPRAQEGDVFDRICDLASSGALSATKATGLAGHVALGSRVGSEKTRTRRNAELRALGLRD